MSDSTAEHPVDLLKAIIRELESRRLVSSRVIRKARGWLPDIERKTPRGAKALVVLCQLGAHLLDADSAGDRLGVRIYRKALVTFVAEWSTGSPGRN